MTRTYTISMKSKYKAIRSVVDGVTFDSKKEARRYKELVELEATGEISELELQPRFELIPAQRVNGKVIERKCEYVADFKYKDRDGNIVVEDVKGLKTDVYRLKRKLLLWTHNIVIKEI